MSDLPDTILFDLDGTLLDHCAAVGRALAVTCEAFRTELGTLPFETLLREFHRINDLLWLDYRAGRLTSAELRLRRMRALLDRCGTCDDSEDGVARISRFYGERYMRSATTFDGVHELLEGLRARGCRLGIVSNGFADIQWLKLEVSGLRDYFPIALFSEDVGAHKPDRRMFDRAADLVGASPEEILFVGDDVECDIVGAGRLGFRTVWFNPSGASWPGGDHGVVPDWSVATIGELARVLGVDIREKGAGRKESGPRTDR
jgi:HAD superfamily hydrolase (TIGR01509 family)